MAGLLIRMEFNGSAAQSKTHCGGGGGAERRVSSRLIHQDATSTLRFLTNSTPLAPVARSPTASRYRAEDKIMPVKR